MPQELFLELLGARRNILFIEGDNDSLDFRIYSILYPQYAGVVKKLSNIQKLLMNKMHYIILKLMGS
ncbi:hypothetical protein [Campylobacter taeniopygiae]|uniref:hypothetical protein n=1 Tax=Campylobacter taeniopygiae TaxID=2510188 RepID=UPI003D6A9EE6